MEQFTAIVVTAAGAKQASAYQAELEHRQKSGLIPKDTFVLAVPDPSSARVGSGGATFNAIVAACEHLSARAGFASVSPDILANSKIVIIHSGGDSRRSPLQSLCGKAWSAVNSTECEEVMTPFDFLLLNLANAFKDSPPGLIVCSSDVLLDFGKYKKEDWARPGVTGLGIPMDIDYGTRHGVYIHDENGRVIEFCQKATVEELRAKGAVHLVQENGKEVEKVALDSGVVFFDAATTQILTNIHLYPPLDACTYMGVDSGANPLRIELYSDIMEALGDSPLTYEDYMNLPTSAKKYVQRGSIERSVQAVRDARAIFWKHLRKIQFNVAVPEQSDFVHVGTTKENIEFLTQPSAWATRLRLAKHVQSYITNPAALSDVVVMNSLVSGDGEAGSCAVIEHCRLAGTWSIGSRAFLSQLRSFADVSVRDGIAVQEIAVSTLNRASPDEGVLTSRLEDCRHAVVICYSIHDSIKAQLGSPQATLCGQSWERFFEVSGLSEKRVWPEGDDRSLWSAKLFPVLTPGEDELDVALWMQDMTHVNMESVKRWRACERISLSDILTYCNPCTSFEWRHRLNLEVALAKMEEVLRNGEDVCVLGIIRKIVSFGVLNELALARLDALATSCDPRRVPRIFSTIADFLAEMAHNKGGLRSGPAHNPDWDLPMASLRAGRLAEAVSMMAALRAKWVNSPERMVRAARHYEAAAQVLVSEVIYKCARSFRRSAAPPLGTWVRASCPIRADLAGGWTDTPPITYELCGGGVCVNVAINLEGQMPVVASARRLKDPVLVLQPPEDSPSSPMVWRTRSDIADYHQPLAPGALFKCAVIALGLVNPASNQELDQQLNFNVGGGIEVRMKSSLPQGSGLGTSSVLSGALLAAICTAVGYEYDADSIVHSVLILEQLLTTGGGWQDQVGGLLPGFKYSESPDRFPVAVKTEVLPVSPAFIEAMNGRLIAIYTGRQRLARSLLQDVIRHWYAREPSILQAVTDLRSNSEVCRQAIRDGDLEAVGRCLSKYWESKRVMAPQSEPKFVVEMREALSDLIVGSSLAGAGGGGFFLCITKEADQLEEVKRRLSKVQGVDDMLFMRAQINMKGLEVTIGDECIGNPLVKE